MKTREEQVEEMAYSVCTMGELSEYITDCSKCGYNDERDCKVLKFARKIYDAGYRKQNDTAREILAEVSRHFGGAWLVELYKKYGAEAEK